MEEWNKWAGGGPGTIADATYSQKALVTTAQETSTGTETGEEASAGTETSAGTGTGAGTGPDREIPRWRYERSTRGA